MKAQRLKGSWKAFDLTAVPIDETDPLTGKCLALASLSASEADCLCEALKKVKSWAGWLHEVLLSCKQSSRNQALWANTVPKDCRASLLVGPGIGPSQWLVSVFGKQSVSRLNTLLTCKDKCLCTQESGFTVHSRTSSHRDSNKARIMASFKHSCFKSFLLACHKAAYAICIVIEYEIVFSRIACACCQVSACLYCKFM